MQNPSQIISDIIQQYAKDTMSSLEYLVKEAEVYRSSFFQDALNSVDVQSAENTAATTTADCCCTSSSFSALYTEGDVDEEGKKDHVQVASKAEKKESDSENSASSSTPPTEGIKEVIPTL